MKKCLAFASLLVFCSSVYAAPIQTILTTTAKGTRLTAAPSAFYGTEFVLQLPVGIAPKLETMANSVDPTSIDLIRTSKLATGTNLSANYVPSSSTTAGDIMKVALTNLNGIDFGTLATIWLEYKAGVSPKYNSAGNVNNATVKVLSFKFFDALGNEIPSSQTDMSINKTYVWN